MIYKESESKIWYGLARIKAFKGRFHGASGAYSWIMVVAKDKKEMFEFSANYFALNDFKLVEIKDIKLAENLEFHGRNLNAIRLMNEMNRIYIGPCVWWSNEADKQGAKKHATKIEKSRLIRNGVGKLTTRS